MTNSYSKFARFQYTSPADIGIEDYNPTIYKMAVLADLRKAVRIKKAKKLTKTKPFDYTYSDAGNFETKLTYEEVCDAIALVGTFKVLRNCFQSAFNEFVLLSRSRDWKTRYHCPMRFMIGEGYTFGEPECFHLNGGLGLKIHHAWVEIDTHIHGVPTTMVIDKSNNQTMLCERSNFYEQWRIHSYNDFSGVVDKAIDDLFTQYPKKSQAEKITKLSVFKIIDIPLCIEIIEEDTIRQKGGILFADYIDRLIRASLFMYSINN